VTKEIESDPAFARANKAKSPPAPETAEEIGDLLFSIVNLTGISSSTPRNSSPAPTTNSPAVSAPWKPASRPGQDHDDCTLEELDAAWNAVKSER